MLTQRLANIVFAILLIIACGYFAWVAEGFLAAGLLASSGLPSKFFPQLTLGFVVLCAVIVIWQALRESIPLKNAKTVFAGPGEARRGLLMLAVAIVCYLIWRNFGFIPMAALMGPMSLIAMGIRNLWIYLTVWILTALIYAIFTQVLNIQLV